ncbi:hypothetical protein LguiB_001878 [Lonicera macranthoides]
MLRVDDESVGIDCPFPILAQWCFISCNGLFLVCCSIFQGLWNPSIRRKMVLDESLFGSSQNVVESWSKKFSFDFELGFGRILGFRESGEVALLNKDNDPSEISPCYLNLTAASEVFNLTIAVELNLTADPLTEPQSRRRQ